MGQNFPVLVSSAGKSETLTGNTIVYVDPAGNDSNDGKTPGTAKQTIQAMVDTLNTDYDANGFSVTIQLADGTYDNAGGNTVLIKEVLGATEVTLQGNTGDVTAVTVANTSASDFVNAIRYPFTKKINTPWFFRFMSLSSTVKAQGEVFSIFAGSAARCEELRFIGVPAGPGFITMMTVGQGARLYSQSLEFAVNSDRAIFAENGYFHGAFGGLTFTGSPTWGVHFAEATVGSMIDVHGSMITGSAIGSRGLASGNGILFYGGITAMGTVAESTSTGGIVI